MALRQWEYFNIALVYKLLSTSQYEMNRPVKPHKDSAPWAIAPYSLSSNLRAHTTNCLWCTATAPSCKANSRSFTVTS